LLHAIKAVHYGLKHVSSEATATVMANPLDKNGKQERSGVASLGLGARERQVLQLVAEGHSSPQVSLLLHIARSTVDVRRRNIMSKLDLRSIAELTKIAVRFGLTAG